MINKKVLWKCFKYLCEENYLLVAFVFLLSIFEIFNIIINKTISISTINIMFSVIFCAALHATYKEKLKEYEIELLKEIIE